MRRSIASLVAAVAVLGMAQPASAGSPDLEFLACPRTGSGPPRTSFMVSGPGASAFVGGWKVSGAHATLCFRGVSVGGFVAALVAGLPARA